MEQHKEAESLPITVWLAGRSYRIRVRPDEESAVRRSIKLADDKVTDMRTHYAGKDDQDFMAMVLLSYAADAATESIKDPLMRDDLIQLSRRIDKALTSSAPEE